MKAAAQADKKPPLLLLLLLFTRFLHGFRSGFDSNRAEGGEARRAARRPGRRSGGKQVGLHGRKQLVYKQYTNIH
jgi:hypothetical protein